MIKALMAARAKKAAEKIIVVICSTFSGPRLVV